MRVLVAHNRYQQRGGEDVVFENESRLLADAGHAVRQLVLSNDDIRSSRDKLIAMLQTVENAAGMAAIESALAEFRPDIVHVHNFFPLLSPGVYRVCRRFDVPVVQTLHNFRTICTGGLLLRDGKTCRLCLDGLDVWGVVHRCYRGSLAGSAACARMISVHRRRRTWWTDVDRYVALSQCSRDIFAQAGFPPHLIDVKPNFIEVPTAPPTGQPRQGVLFVGRLSPEKGVLDLVRACLLCGFPLRIIGDGPQRRDLQTAAAGHVEFLGPLPRDAVLDEMRRAAVVAVPSICLENFGMVVIEAFACATPVVVSGLGALKEIVQDGCTGFHVPPAEPAVLGECIARLLADPTIARHLGHTARQVYLERFTAAANLPLLEAVYARAISSRRKYSN